MTYWLIINILEYMTEATKNEILEAINDFSTETDKNFRALKQEIGGMKQEISGIKATMVTKDYLDRKTAEQKGDLIIMIRKEDEKVDSLLSQLDQRHILPGAEVARLTSLGPFPKLKVSKV